MSKKTKVGSALIGVVVLSALAPAVAQQRVISTAGQGVEVTQTAAPAVPSEPSSPGSASAATAASSATAASAATSATSATNATELRRVFPGESLMSISREVAASRNVSLAQAMVGLYRTNPSAFLGGDMSQLLVGAELRVPDRAALTVITRAAAFREVQQRLGIWGGAPAAAVEAGPPEVTPPAPRRASTPATAPAAGPAPAPAAKPTSEADSAAAESAPPDAATLQAELAAQQAKVAELEAALEEARSELATSIAPAATPTHVIEQRLGNLWWLWGVALAVIALLAILLRGQSRRAAQAEEEARTADAALVRAHRELQTLQPDEPESTPSSTDTHFADDAPLAADTFVQTLSQSMPSDPVIRAEPESKVSFDEVMSATADDLEGDPPPIEEAGSMIDLARAYIEMGDYNAAMTELQLALKNGNEAQRAEALRLLDSLPKS